MRLLEVSDHAVLRYIERVLGYETEVLREVLADAVGSRLAGTLDTRGANSEVRSIIFGGVQYRIEENRVLADCRPFGVEPRVKGNS